MPLHDFAVAATIFRSLERSPVDASAVLPTSHLEAFSHFPGGRTRPIDALPHLAYAPLGHSDGETFLAGSGSD